MTAKQRITVKRILADQNMETYDCQTVERILARMIAFAFASDHPHLFNGKDVPSSQKQGGEG